MQFRILIVEDHADISDIVKKYFEREGYEAEIAADGFEALEKFAAQRFDLVLLDIMMPGIDGFEVLREIRASSDVPVIMLTAKQEEVDRLKGFDQGADDYVVKPFSPRELVRRAHAVLKRVYGVGDDPYLTCGSLKLFTRSMHLSKNEIDVPITSAEYKLLLVFFKHIGQVLSREQLIVLAYGTDYEGYDRNIDSYIKRIRQKIEDDPKQPAILLTKYGAGYQFGGERV
jgi:DNA-binding response OmpR family regulator